jgi:plastocyanin
MSAALPGILKQRAFLRLGVCLAAAALAAAACAPAEEPPNIPVKQEGRLLIQVVDQLYDAGRGASVGLHQDGTPAVSYLLYDPVLKRGDIPPPVLAGQPQPPAVIFATISKGVWNRVSVTPQKTSPAEGDAPELANDQGQALPGVRTSIAVDGQDKHHVAWSTPKGGVFYSTDAGGSFGEAEKIIGSPAYGVSIAVGTSGTPWISFYSGGSLRVAQRSGAKKWTIDDVQKNAGPAAAPATGTAIRVTSGGDPIVAYGDKGKTVVARRTGGAWNTEQVPGEGGYGVSLALDKSGNPHVAFYDASGNVREARPTGGGPWQVSDLGTTVPKTSAQSDERWSTGIGLNDQGAAFAAWADTKANQIILAEEKGGSFDPQPVTGSTNGANPSLAVSADGKFQALAWFDSANANLEVAQTPAGGLSLAHALPTNAPPSGAVTTPPAATCEPGGTTIKMTAQDTAFDTNCLAAPAGKAFTIDFTIQDASLHNLEIFTDSSATTRLGGAKDATDIVAGPASVTYKVDALKAGTYYFHCDVHPQQMTGTFVVK